MSKVIQIAAVSTSTSHTQGDHALYVLFDDGSLFVRERGQDWSELDQIKDPDKLRAQIERKHLEIEFNLLLMRYTNGHKYPNAPEFGSHWTPAEDQRFKELEKILSSNT